MTLLEPAIYPIALVLLFLLVYIFPFSHLEKYMATILLLPTWHGNIAGKEYPLKSIEPPTVGVLESPPPSTLPRSWWTGEKQFQLERRAIFGKNWLFVSHTSKFQKPGDYRTFEIAGFSILLILGKDNHVRAFHNVCRHRAYAVTKKESGSTTVLGCRYHGWSYDTKGKLIKAPEFDKVPGFDKSSNGLWELKSEIREGMVFVNFDAGEAMNVLPLEVPRGSKFSNLKFVADWKVEGAFNWKLAVPGISKRLEKRRTLPFWSTFLRASFDTSQGDIVISPNTIIRRLNSGSLLTLRFLPNSAKSTTIDCCVYTGDKYSMRNEDIDNAKADVQTKIEQLKIQHERILLGNLPPLDGYLNQLDELLEAHHEEEKAFGVEINPAARSQNITQVGRNDDECKF